METRYITDDVWVLSKFSENRYSKNTFNRCFIEKPRTKPNIDDPSIMGYYPPLGCGKCVEPPPLFHFLPCTSKDLPSRKSRKISNHKLLINNKENLEKSMDEIELISHTIPPTFFVGSPENYFISHLESRLDAY